MSWILYIFRMLVLHTPGAARPKTIKILLHTALTGKHRLFTISHNSTAAIIVSNFEINEVNNEHLVSHRI